MWRGVVWSSVETGGVVLGGVVLGGVAQSCKAWDGMQQTEVG